MLKNAPIILDEAAANVAPENGKKLMDAIEALPVKRPSSRAPTGARPSGAPAGSRRRTASAAALLQSGDGPGTGKYNQKGDGREPPAIAFFAAYGA